MSASDVSQGDSVTAQLQLSAEVLTALPPVIGQFSQRVNSGGSAYTDSKGNKWDADKSYSSGSWGYMGGKTYKTSTSIADTVDDPVYQTERYGNFSYQFDVPNGLYNVSLDFAEIYQSSVGKRIFNVQVEGQQILTNYDIYAEAGRYKAVRKIFSGINVADGQLNIRFITVKDNAKVSGITV